MKMRTVRAFTLIEGLVMLLIVAIGMAVSIPLFISGMKDANAKKCRANMQAIAKAEQQYKIKASPHAYTTDLSKLVGDFRVSPICPNVGTYNITISDGTSASRGNQTVPAGLP